LPNDDVLTSHRWPLAQQRIKRFEAMDSSRPRTVFKLGGSLLDQADWPARLRRWLSRQPTGDYYGIVGGGELVEAMRSLDTRHSLSIVEMHWRCIRLLDATYEIAGELMPELGRLDNLDSAVKASPLAHSYGRGVGGEVLSTVDPSRLHDPITEDEPGFLSKMAAWVRIAGFYGPNRTIPFDSPEESWNTTTDTLALVLAGLLQADRCVLLKSCSTKQIESLAQAARLGIVDAECVRFEKLVARVELESL
jgi:aspartokinase-like uncharacterized kinase